MSQDGAKQRRVAEGDGSHLTGHERLIRTLLSIGELSQIDQEAIRTLPGQARKLDAYQDIVSEGDRPEAIAIIVSGFACRYKTLENGRRQIVSFHVAGDAPDIQSLYISRMDHSIGTLQDSVILHIRHDALFELFKKSPNVLAIFWRWTLIEASVFREWVTNIGQREAYQRMAHLFCELVTRSRAVGLVEGQTCEFPITQVELADTSGLSPVHVNRTLQALRAEKLIQLRAGALTILDWEGLKKAGGFDPTMSKKRTKIAKKPKIAD